MTTRRLTRQARNIREGDRLELTSGISGSVHHETVLAVEDYPQPYFSGPFTCIWTASGPSYPDRTARYTVLREVTR